MDKIHLDMAAFQSAKLINFLMLAVVFPFDWLNFK